MAKKVKTEKQTHEELGRMLANIYDTGYIDKNQFYKMSFIKGLVTGVGSVLGATIVVALLLWVLSLFDNVPLIGRFTDTVQDTVQSGRQ